MKKIVSILLFMLPLCAISQSNNAPSSYDPHEIAITGYLQTQYQRAQSAGIQSFSGGDFSKNSAERFMIRRGRLKIDRADKYSNIVFQIDATQNGVMLMDAFIQLHKPGSKTFLLTAGLFNRPFGHSIVYSSGYRDFPERARVFQTIMPRERDIGAMVTYNPSNAFKFITAELAVLNGSGYNSRDYDSKKDVVGNLAFKFDSLANKRFHIGFGGSFYKGSVRSNTESYFTNNANGYIRNTSPDHVNWNAPRNYYGLNVQLQYDNTFGKTLLKTEYVEGKQPGIAASPTVTGTASSMSFSSQPETDLFLRSFNGYYIWLTQQVFKTGLTAMVSYDAYDPNTNIGETEIGRDNNTTAGDIKFSTLGYGVSYLIGSRIKLTLYNEQVVNDGTGLPKYINDLKDDVFTTRLQYRW